MRIALILTGGTICSFAASDGARRSNVTVAQTLLEQHYRNENPYSSVQFQTVAPLNKLSEDLTPDDWLVLLRSIAALDCSAFDGIMIAHGTDTLEQTAAMLSAALCGISVPVILVSAIAPPDDPSTNGHANFASSVRLICRHLAPGVWVVYENSDGQMFLHRGFELQPCSHDSLSFYSTGMKPVSDVIEGEPIQKSSICGNAQILPAETFSPADVLLLRPYNGLRYDTIDLSGYAAVVHGTYHSETANASRYSPYAMQTLLLRCQKENLPCFLAPCHVRQQSYGSGYDLVQAGAIPLENMTLPFAYGAVWVSCMQGFCGDALTAHVRQLRQSLDSQSFRCCI